MNPIFEDRIEAGRLLGRKLSKYADRDDVLVLALPRGGVPVAFEVAQTLHAALDIFVVRKLGVPGHEEFAMGAIASGGVCVLNRETLSSLHIPPHLIERVAAVERRELERREQVYRSNRLQPEIAGKTVILVDDGVATGSTMLAALQALRKKLPAHLVVAVPVASESAAQALESAADEFVAVLVPEIFFGVGRWYVDFSQTTDAEVRDLLAKSHLRRTVLPAAKAA